MLLLVVPFVSAALGTDPATSTVKSITQALTNSQLTGDQILAMKQAEIDFQKHLSDHDLTLDQLRIADNQSARQMQIGTKSIMPGVLATFAVACFVGLVFGVLHGVDVAAGMKDTFLILVGAAITVFKDVYGFYFGSSAGSQAKDNTINNMTK